MPFGRENSSSLELSFFDSLPPLEPSGCVQHTAAQQSLFEGLQELRSSSSSGAATLYRLVLLDEAGKPSGYPSEQDLARLIEGKPLPAPKAPKPEQQEPPAPPAPKEPSFQELLAETHKRGGPVCSHCGATESPQWRRGPPHKAILCNACGTRYRRTNQLGSSVPSNLRKRGAAHLQPQQQCGSQALKGQQPVAKQPRVVA
ncbi:hypothetical protein ABPG75_006684 [Micractinium tetrahymenae]